MRFIESILYRDGSYHNLELHQERINHVFSKHAPANSSHNLSMILPDLKMLGTYKVRLVYDTDTENAAYELEYSEYYPRSIKSLQVVAAKPFNYTFKYEDRSNINDLLKTSAADDILIAIDDHITDGSYFNVAFWDGKSWLTPDTPLLKGVRRTQLLSEGSIAEREIHGFRS